MRPVATIKVAGKCKRWPTRSQPKHVFVKLVMPSQLREARLRAFARP